MLDEDCNAVITSSSHQPGDIFEAGITTVTYIASNEAGFETTCSFNVIVAFDNTTTTLLCPLDITVNATPGECTTSVVWAPPTLDNGCTLSNLAGTYEPGDNFPAGTTTVTYVGTDAAGNIFECSFDITVVNEDGNAVFDCPNDITIPLFPGQCQASVLWIPPEPDEDCGVTIISNTHEPGDIFSVGTTTVIYVAVDGAGNTFECRFDITLTYGNQVPELVCPNDITVNANIGTCTTSVVWTPPLLDNGCELSNLVSNYEPGDIFPTGTTTVSYTGADTGGNVFECSFDVTVINNGAPIILSCPDDIDLILNTASGVCGVTASWDLPVVDENCDVVSIVGSHSPGDSFPVGVTTVTYVVTDGSGNSSTCSFDVQVVYDFIPSLVCPPDITTDADPNSCLTSVTWELPVLDNGCEVGTYISNYEPGDNFPAGTTTVTYTGIDSGGNEFECTFDITVISDGQNTVWECPGNITVTPQGGGCETPVTWEPPVPDTNCDIISVTSNYEPGDIFPVGTTTVIYTATDGSGNTFECAFDITVEDLEPIVEIICQDDIINIFTTDGECNAPVVWGPPTVVDNCAALVTITSTHNSGDIFPIGITTVTYTATDPGGSTASCSFDVIVTDKEVPVIACPDDIMANNEPGQCGASVSWQIPNATDNCGASVSSDYQPGDFFSVGSTIVTYIATDDAGNTAECTFTVTVRDIEPPVVQICTEDIVVAADPGECGAIVDWSVPIVADNCQAAPVGSTHVPGSFFPIGTTFVLYGILDESGNGNVCTFNVTVVDEEAPTIDCPVDITVFTDPGQCNAVVEWAVPEPIDNCTASITSSSHNPGDTFPIGTTTVTHTATDDAGLEVSCSFNIIVIDKEVPTITCPDDITVNNAPGQCFASVSWAAPTVNDNCGVTEINTTHQPGSLFPVGMTTVEYTITDEEGNTTACSFIVTVNDNEIPQVLECPSDIVVTADPGTCSAVVDWEPPTTVDNCSSIIAGSTHTPGALFPVGTTPVLYGILDASGNGTTCVFNVTVLDEELPILNCPADITVSTDPGSCEAVVNWTIPTPFDNCGASITSSSHQPGDVFPLGTTTVTYTAEDFAGEQEVSCSFDINVVDTEPPAIVCPDDIFATNAPGECGGIVNWNLPSISDNCQDVDISISHFPGDFFPVGNTLVTYTLTDTDGNVTECTFTIIVEDIEPPTVTGCPDDIVVPNDPGDCSAFVTWDPPTFSDNCEVLSVESKPSPGSLFPIGTTNVLYEAIDAAGNITTCMFTVTVEDTEDPMLTCPADITVSNDDGECGAIVNWTPPIPIDNCGAEITSNTHDPGDFFIVGTTTVTYTTVNSEGVELTCSFDITVEDREDPVLTCPADITVPFDNGACDAAVNWEVGVSDNCEAEITSSTHNSGDTFSFGTTTVTYTAEDGNGNTDVCSFDITVTDNEAPVILNCPEDITVAGPPGECLGPVIIPTPQFGIDYSDCQSETTIINDYNNSPNASDIYPVGTTVITWTVTDPAGNTVTCQQTVIVIPTDFDDDVAFVTDRDVFVGAGIDNAAFNESDSIIIVDPGVPDNAVVNTVIMDFFFRPEGNSCERDVEVEITDPGGNVFPIFIAPTGSCSGNDGIFQFLLTDAFVPTQSSGGGVWKLRFRDTDDQNPVSAGPPDGNSVPPGTEFSVRFGRINYDITITPNCSGGGIVEEDDDTPSVLPIELAYFKGTEQDCEAILSWGTSSEINVSHFEIQRSYDGSTFSMIDRVNALGGEGIATDYTYTDTQLTLTNYYRLKIVDNDGRIEYSEIFTIQADCAAGVSISDVFPNPTVNQLISVQFNSNMDHENARVIVRDMLGRTMMEVPITVFLGANMITVDPTRLAAAQYILVIEGADWRSSPARFIKLD